MHIKKFLTQLTETVKELPHLWVYIRESAIYVAEEIEIFWTSAVDAYYIDTLKDIQKDNPEKEKEIQALIKYIKDGYVKEEDANKSI